MISILNGLMETAELRATAHITKLNGRYIHIDIEGKDVSFLIGKRGEVLNALQYLLNVITARQITNGVRVVLEGDSYRERRAQTLTDMALKLAQEVRARGEEAVLDALPAFERRVIHQAIVDLEGVTTYSEGEEPNRRVVIAPSA
ncbi:MAG: KH domain-containing protein [Armatimonadetes bacterium]|nr:KH domain-containing protein [Armatimonadota bacterium]